MNITPALVPVLWGAVASLVIASVVFTVSLGSLLGAQRPVVLRVIWISAAVILTAVTALVVILINT